MRLGPVIAAIAVAAAPARGATVPAEAGSYNMDASGNA
jgi:hypothetical protein